MKKLVLATALAATPFAASAGELSYTYVEGGFSQMKVDSNDATFGDFTGDGGYLRGAVAVSPQFYLFGGYAKVSDSDNVSGTKVEDDVSQAEAGIGYHQAMGERLDFLAELSYMRLEEKISARGIGSFEEDAKGGRIAIGLRGQMSEPLEGWIKAGYIDGGDFSGDFVGTLGGQFKFNPTWGLVGEVEIIDDVTRYTAGVRASF